MPETQQNTIGLQMYYDARLASLEKEIQLRAEQADLAIRVAREATDYRLAGMNELQGAMEDQARHFATREEVARLREALGAEIAVLRDNVETEIRALSKQVYLIAGAFVVVEALVFFLLKG